MPRRDLYAALNQSCSPILANFSTMPVLQSPHSYGPLCLQPFLLMPIFTGNIGLEIFEDIPATKKGAIGPAVHRVSECSQSLHGSFGSIAKEGKRTDGRGELLP